MIDMLWKTYYRDELDHPDTKEYLDTVFSYVEGDAPLDHLIDTGSILSFPHTALRYSAIHQARVVVSLYRTGVERVIALGVLHLWGHSVSSRPYHQAMSPEEEPSGRQLLCARLAGAFAPVDPTLDSPFGKISLDLASLPASDAIRRDSEGLLADEFSLDTFFSLLRYYYLINGRPLPRITPFYVGMTRDPVTGSFAIARQLAADVRDMLTSRTAVVATGDVIHYGSGYSSQEKMSDMPADVDDLKKIFRDELENVLTQAVDRRQYERAFSALDVSLNNDQRFLLPVIAELSGKGAGHEVISFELSDYSSINHVNAPCVVASSLVAYTPDRFATQGERV